MDCADCLRRVWRRIDTTTSSRQRGQYSIERMCELSEYCQRTPLWQVLLVFLVSVLPSLATIVALDSMPLQDPYAGWDNNSVMWVRVFVGTFVLSVGVMLQLRALVPAVSVTAKQSLSISVLLAVVFSLTAMLIAKCWVFPVPFMMLLANPPWSLTLFASVGLVAGCERLTSNPEILFQLKRFSNLINFAALFLVIFPVYITVFRSLEGVNQFAFIFVLPLLKMLLKKGMQRIVADVEELVPAVIISVDFFNALFQAKCMQTAGSIWTTVGIISIDAIQNIYSLRRLFGYMADVEKQQEHDVEELFAYCVALLRSPELLDLRALRVQSLKSATLSPEKRAILQHLRRLAQDGDPHCRDRPDLSFEDVGVNAVVPWSSVSVFAAKTLDVSPPKVVPLTGEALAKSGLALQQQTVVLKKTLELLWRCESVLLVEYIEAAVPLVYGVSMSILYYLPNAKYYPGMTEMTPAKLHSTIVSILVYSTLEFGSLIYLHVILKWKFQISALHQLAFVLENQWLSIQGMFLAWVIIVLGFTLVHYGNDFTFKFEWIH